MPRGVYPRTKNQLEAAKKNLAKGREKPAREKAAASLRTLAKTEEWRRRVSNGTKKALNQPETRKKHLEAIKQSQETKGINFTGGNGQEPVPFVVWLAEQLESEGFVRELPIKTKGYKWLGLKLPSHYKLDIANPTTKVAIEVDGPSHAGFGREEQDRKKQTFLLAAGWKLLRIKYDRNAVIQLPS